MTSKCKHGYKQKFGTREYQPLSRKELRELVDSLSIAPEGTTLITIKEQKTK